DAAGLLVIFKKGGNTISYDAFKLMPTSGSGYIFFSDTLQLGSQPDTVIIGITSSYGILNGGKYNTGEIPGSTLYIDDLAFTGAGTMPAIPGGDFESGWTTDNAESADGWQPNGDPGTVFQSTDAYAGKFALKLEETSDGGETNITNGKA